MSRFNLKHTQLVLTLLALGGCSQILGLGDYDVDPSLDEPGAGGDDSGGTGNTNAGGKGNVIPSIGGEGGTPSGQGGSGADAGMANEGGLGGAGNAQGGVPSDAGAAGAGGAGGAGTEPEDCDSPACCTLAGGIATGVELLSDGGFELGTVADGATPWLEESTNALPAITDVTNLGWEPRDGFYYAYLSGYPGEETTIFSEDVTIPADAGWIELTGYRNFQIDAQDAINTDFAAIGFYGDAMTDLDEDPFYWTHPSDPGSNGWGQVADWTRFTASWSAAPHQGKVRYLAITGYSDEYPVPSNPNDTKASSYLFDSLSLKVFRCQK